MMIMLFKGVVWDFLQSSHCAANCLHDTQSCSQSTAVCKWHVTHRALGICNIVMCNVVQRGTWAVHFDRVAKRLLLVIVSFLSLEGRKLEHPEKIPWVELKDWDIDMKQKNIIINAKPNHTYMDTWTTWRQKIMFVKKMLSDVEWLTDLFVLPEI